VSESKLPGNNVVPELSAIASRPAPRSIRLAAPRLAVEAKRVADVGCGYMRGTRELLRHHDAVYAVDSERQRARIAAEIDVCSTDRAFRGFRSWDQFRDSKLRLGGAYVVNVLHTLPFPRERIELLRGVHRNLAKGAFLLLDVPYYEHYYKGRMTSSNSYSDGYIFRQGPEAFTFYRFTTTDELDTWADSAGFEFDFRIADNHHWVRIYRPA
jgi:SAM-dependent methyltransferase